MGSRPHLWICACKTACLPPELIVSMGPIETCNSGPKVALLNAQNHRLGLGPIETSDCDARNAVLHAQNDRSCLGPIKACYSRQKVAVLHVERMDEAWDPWRLVIQELNTLFFTHKTTSYVWDP